MCSCFFSGFRRVPAVLGSEACAIMVGTMYGLELAVYRKSKHWYKGLSNPLCNPALRSLDSSSYSI